MSTDEPCPICGTTLTHKPKNRSDHDAWHISCDVCGQFYISDEAVQDFVRSLRQTLTPIHAATASYLTRQKVGMPMWDGKPLLTTVFFEELLRDRFELPTPPEQADKLLRLIGNNHRSEGQELKELPKDVRAQIGAFSNAEAEVLVIELEKLGLVRRVDSTTMQGPKSRNISLTLRGWEKWRGLGRRGGGSANGFIAMQFGDALLDQIVKERIQPDVKHRLGIAIVRVDDEKRAGLIDNIMRQHIQDAAFVLADLTHGNKGAYWEAGYAEGLGKPVIYLCERDVFDSGKAHFDVNHSQTVMWDKDDLDQFINDLCATIKNTLQHMELDAR